MFVSAGSAEYWLLLVLLLTARGADFLSTWIATPRLSLEANPVARRLGWRGGLILNLTLCFLLATWPMPAVVVATTSVLVASRNLQSAWLSRSMGEEAYRAWFCCWLRETPGWLYYGCLGGQSVIYVALGCAIALPFRGSVLLTGLGAGFVAYAVLVPLYTWLGVRGLLKRAPASAHDDPESYVPSNPRAFHRTDDSRESDSSVPPSVGRL